MRSMGLPVHVVVNALPDIFLSLDFLEEHSFSSPISFDSLPYIGRLSGIACAISIWMIFLSS